MAQRHVPPRLCRVLSTPPQPLRSLFPMATEDALDLLARMFTFDPTVRITAEQASDTGAACLPPLFLDQCLAGLGA